MGESVAGLIAHELETVVRDGDDAGDVFTDQVARRVEERASRLDARERELDARVERLRINEVHLAAWENQIHTQRMPGASTRTVMKEGRNERCACGSGRKYKYCHGAAGSRTQCRLLAVSMERLAWWKVPVMRCSDSSP